MSVRHRSLVLVVVMAACSSGLPTSTTSQELVGAPSGTAAFPSTQVGQTSAAQAYEIYETTRSVGFHSDTISSIAYSCPDFTVTWASGVTSDDCENDTCNQTAQHAPQTICPGPPVLDCYYDDIYSFSAVFHPTVAAPLSCVLTITSTSGTQTYTLSGTGTPLPIHVTAAPGSVNFGGVRINTSSTGVGVTVTNSGGGAATVSSVGVSSGFQILSGTTTSHSLGAGASEPYSIACHPTAVGALNGTMSIASDDPNTPNISIPLACSGIDSNLAVTPSPAVLPTTRVGEPVQQTITITNMGGAATTLQDVTVSGVDMVTAPPANTPLAANAMTTATVSFDAAAAGTVSGMLHIDYDSDKSVDVPISAQALSTSMSLTPDGAVDFGPVCAGQTKTQMFSLIANDAGPFQLTAVSAPDAPFTVATPTLPAAVQGNAGNTVMFGVTAAPTDAGDVTSTIGVTTDIPNGTPDMISVTVTGLPVGVSATPPTVDVGPAQIMTTTLAQPITLSNCGDSPVTIANAIITGDDAASFAIVSNPTSSQVDANSNATWLVVMTAQTVGNKAATFEADYDGGSATVALTGEPYVPGGATGGDDGGTVDKSSYYACSTGHATTLWPIALALAFLARRRRRS